MGKKWATVSTATYADDSPSDDGAATEANRVKYDTIKSDLTDPLDTAIDEVVANLDELFSETAVSVTTDYTSVASDHAKLLEVTGGKTITALAAAIAGPGYRFWVYANGGNVTVSRSGSDTVNSEQAAVIGEGHIALIRANAAGNGYWATPTPAVLGVATTASGRTATISGIPPWAKEVTLMLHGTSLSGNTDSMEIRLGTDSGFVATGYLGAVRNTDGSTTLAHSTGFRISPGNTDAPNGWYGFAEFKRGPSNMWSAKTQFAVGTGVLDGAGGVTLSDNLSQVRLLVTGSTDDFDAGSISLLYR